MKPSDKQAAQEYDYKMRCVNDNAAYFTAEDAFLAGCAHKQARIDELEALLLRTFIALDKATDASCVPDHIKDDSEFELERFASNECSELSKNEIIIALRSAEALKTESGGSSENL